MLDSSMFFLLLSACVFCAEQVEGVKLKHLAHDILVTSPESKFLFPSWLGLGTWTYRFLGFSLLTTSLVIFFFIRHLFMVSTCFHKLNYVF